MKRRKNETDEEWSKRLDETDFHKIKNALRDSGIDYQVIWGPNAIILLNGTYLQFDKNHVFEIQDRFFIKDVRLAE